MTLRQKPVGERQAARAGVRTTYFNATSITQEACMLTDLDDAMVLTEGFTKPGTTHAVAQVELRLANRT